MTNEIEVYGLEAKIIDAGCRQYRDAFVIPEAVCNGVKVLKLQGFSVEELDSGGAAVTSLIKNGALIRIEGGFEIAFKWRK